MDKKNLRACIFDLDGVIVDTAKYHFQAWKKLCNGLGFDLTEAENEKLKGVSRTESLDLILALGGVSLSAEEKLHWADQKNEWYLEYIEHIDSSEILPGVHSFLYSLKNDNIKIGLGSASKNAVKILKKIELYDLFDVVVDGNMTTKSKPNPEVFLKGAELLGYESKEIVVFEDAEKGIAAAIEGGFRAVGVGQADVLPDAHWIISSFEHQTIEGIIRHLTK